LAQPELRQLAQRITARYHLTPLDRDETEAYVRHRLAVAGNVRVPFSRLGLRALYQRSGGIPRLINVIADRALMAGFARDQDSIGERLVDRAADETLPGHARYWLRRYGRWAAALLILAGAGVLWQLLIDRSPQTPAQASTPKPAVVAAPADDIAAKMSAALKSNPESELTAWSTLLSRWQVNSTDIAVRDALHCQPVVFAGLDCLRGHGTLEQLARFDRPLILPLERDGARGYALMQAITDANVTLSFAGETLQVPRKRLGEFWNGEFIALWRLPDTVTGTLKAGDAGPGVAWIKNQLAHMDGKAADAGPAYFDPALEERVRKLQTAYGIKPDGIVGPETLFALSALDDNGPHLARSVQ
ncbi:MAG TPA: peptidoglycan-binding protein, partial [Rudaea sp.]